MRIELLIQKHIDWHGQLVLLMLDVRFGFSNHLTVFVFQTMSLFNKVLFPLKKN
jgi:hypothetical protein